MYKKSYRFMAVLLTMVMLFTSLGITGYSATGLEEWNIQAPGEPDYKVFVDNTAGYNSKSSMAVFNNTPATSNVYVMISRNVNVLSIIIKHHIADKFWNQSH